MNEHWRRIGRRDRILVSLLLQTAAHKAARYEKLREEIDALNMLCEPDSLFGVLVRPNWSECALLGTTRKAWCETIMADDALSVTMKILDAASMSMSLHR